MRWEVQVFSFSWMKWTKWSFDTVSVKSECLSDFCSSMRTTVSSHCQNIRLFLHCLQQQQHDWCVEFTVFNHWLQRHTALSCIELTIASQKCTSNYQTVITVRRHVRIWWNSFFRSLVHCIVSGSVVVIFSVLASAHCHHPWICILTAVKHIIFPKNVMPFWKHNSNIAHV